MRASILPANRGLRDIMRAAVNAIEAWEDWVTPKRGTITLAIASATVTWVLMALDAGHSARPKPPVVTAGALNGADPETSYLVERGNQEFAHKNFTVAHGLYLVAAEHNNTEAMTNIGRDYALGLGVPRDPERAVIWYRAAAMQGHARAQNNLGVAYATGQGIAPDHTESLHWFSLASRQGNAASMYNIGAQYAAGDGVPRDTVAALGWYEQAAALGEAAAMRALSTAYAQGLGVAQNEAAAKLWLERALRRESEPRD